MSVDGHVCYVLDTIHQDYTKTPRRKWVTTLPENSSQSCDMLKRRKLQRKIYTKLYRREKTSLVQELLKLRSIYGKNWKKHAYK